MPIPSCVVCNGRVDFLAMCVNDSTHDTEYEMCRACGGHGDGPYVNAAGKFRSEACDECGGDGVISLCEETT